MSHPFELGLSDLKAIELNFEQQLTDEEAEKVQGGSQATTLAIGEEGGGHYTTLAITINEGEAGEEGGGGVTSYALTANQGEAGEEGGGPVATTHYILHKQVQ